MTRDEMHNLKPGMMVRHKQSSQSLIIHGNYGDHSIAVRTTYVSNPTEWDIVDEQGHVISED